VLPRLSPQVKVNGSANAAILHRLCVDPGVDDQTSAGLEVVRLAMLVGRVEHVEQRRGRDLCRRAHAARRLGRGGRVDRHARVVGKTHGGGLRQVAPPVGVGGGCWCRRNGSKRAAGSRAGVDGWLDGWMDGVLGGEQRQNECERECEQEQIKRVAARRKHTRQTARQTEERVQEFVVSLLAAGRLSPFLERAGVCRETGKAGSSNTIPPFSAWIRVLVLVATSSRRRPSD
jgi:hypothetical protein